MINFKVVTVGMFEVNCYLVQVAESRRLYIIDPGDDAEKVVEAAAEFDYDEAVILLTHVHVDHIRGVPGVYEKLNVKYVMVHPDDQEFYYSPYNQLQPFLPAAENLPECVGEIPNPDFEVIHTPGHIPGAVCYRFGDALFCGDTLFANSIGRTDLPGGDHATLLKSIESELMILPDDLKVYPGHGPATTIGAEKKHNPYIN